MTAPSLIIVIDRGGLKAYAVSQTPARRPQLKLEQAFDIPNVNDLSRTRHTTATKDWPQLEIEENRRICQQLADEIANVVRRHGAEGWSLAAPKAIHNQIVHLLPEEVRDRIVEQVACDLRSVPLPRLAKHFQSLQPV